MKISALNKVNSVRSGQIFTNNKIMSSNSTVSNPIKQNSLDILGIYNKSLVSFKGYCGDSQPAKKLFWILTGRNSIYEDNYTKENLYAGGNTGYKKWIDVNPEDLLKRAPSDAIQSICTLVKKDGYPNIPEYIQSPNFGDKWGRRATYIEINPRTVALTQDNKKSEGLLNVIKMLPAIPPSGNSNATCLILSQLFPTYNRHNDGYTGDASLYSIDLESGISKNLTSEKLERDGQRMGDDELVKAFNDLAHLRGLKTGIRMPLSAGQLNTKYHQLNWHSQEDEDKYINACVWAINLGFDAIYFDSAKHIGNYDMGNYCGCGEVPDYKQMQYITQQIRERSGRNDISFIGEKCTVDNRFEQLGLNAGADWGNADNFDSVMHEYDKQSWNDNYAAGPIISDDNDENYYSLNQRLNRIKNSFHAFRESGKRLPVFLQMNDIFPACPYTSTHQLMLEGKNMSAYGDIDSHYNNTFNTSDEARNFRHAVYNEFRDVIYQ